MTQQPHQNDRVTIGSIVIRCYEFHRMREFWKAALLYEVGHADPNGGLVILMDPKRPLASASLRSHAIRSPIHQQVVYASYPRDSAPLCKCWRNTESISISGRRHIERHPTE